MNNRGQKTRILIASVLKPVDEPRAFEKIGQTLSNNGFEIFISGATVSSDQTVDSISFLPHKVSGRISLSRIAARFKILKAALKLKPVLLIVSTHELLGIALIFRFLTGGKIIYEVRENYFNNILHTNVFPKILRPLVASLVRWKEFIASQFFSGFILAEKCYEQELSFVKKNFCVIENKCKLPPNFERNPYPDFIKLVFTGTLGYSTGIFQAIELTKKLHQLDSTIKLEIVGYCALPHVLRKIKAEIQNCSFISLIGGDHFVSHSKIFEAISSAHFGIISYPIMMHTKDKIPTKLYEYLSCGLPLLLQANPAWEKIVQPYKAAVIIDYSYSDAKEVYKKLKQVSFRHNIEEAQWQSEEKELLSFINSFLHPA